MTAPPVIYLHIGAMKTGTTFLQRLMERHKADLDGVGVLFPGRTWRKQADGVRDVLGRTFNDPVLTRRCRGAWATLTDEMLAYRGQGAVLSMEFLSHATADQAARVVRSFTERGAEVHVVLTVRDTTRLLPAQWQTQCRNGSRVSWPDYVHGAMSLSTPWRRLAGDGARSFAKAQDVPAMLERWGEAVPGDRTHVITVPGSTTDPMLLWKRFASVLAVDPSVCWRVPDKSNFSLGHASADLMRRINVELGHVQVSDYAPVMKNYLAKEVLAPRASWESPAALDLTATRFAARWNRRIVRAIEAMQVQTVGDLDDLPTRITPAARASSSRRLTDPTDDDLVEAAGAAFDGFQRWFSERADDAHPVSSAETGATADRWRHEPRPVTAATRELAGLARSAMQLRRGSQVARPDRQLATTTSRRLPTAEG